MTASRQRGELSEQWSTEVAKRSNNEVHLLVVVADNMNNKISLHGDLARLQGRWLQIGYERDGLVEPVDDEKNWQPITEISGETFAVTIADGSKVLDGEFRLDETRDPKIIDWIDVAGPIASDKPILAIYRFTEIGFEFCAAYDGAPRPTEFSTKPGLVLRRMRRL